MSARLPKSVFYILTFTWGLPFTLIGLAAALFLRLRGHTAQKYGYCYRFRIGKNWGGINLGLFFIVDERAGKHTCDHEHGHAIQNCYFGPFMLLLVALPSLIRSRYRSYLTEKKGVDARALPPYDSAWFEGQATRLGTDLLVYIAKNDE
jgi:hypothetical protein